MPYGCMGDTQGKITPCGSLELDLNTVLIGKGLRECRPLGRESKVFRKDEEE